MRFEASEAIGTISLLVVAHVDLVDVRRPVAAVGLILALDVDLPDATENVEIIDVGTLPSVAIRAWSKIEPIRDAQRLRFHAVDVEEHRRRWSRCRSRTPASAAGWRWRRRAVPASRWRSATGSCPSSASRMVLEAARGGEADDRRQVEGDDVGFADARCPVGEDLLRISACAESAVAAGAPSKGFSLTTMKPLFDSLAASSSEKPDHREGLVDLRKGLHQRLDLASPPPCVRATEAPSGSWIDMKKAPWSSSGRKPVGVIDDR